MSNEDKPVTIKQFNEFMESLTSSLNKVQGAQRIYHSHTCKRLDDIEQRLERIENNIQSVKKDTEIIPNIFEILHTDGDDIAKLTTRVTKLEN